MYPILLALHSLVRWFVLGGLLFAIIWAYRGWLSHKPFTKFDERIRWITATIAHIQLVIGVWLYFISPIVNYFLHNFALDTTAGAATVKDSAAISMLPKNIEFRNHVLARIGTRMELQELYRKADSLALQVQAALPKKDS